MQYIVYHIYNTQYLAYCTYWPQTCGVGWSPPLIKHGTAPHLGGGLESPINQTWYGPNIFYMIYLVGILVCNYLYPFYYFFYVVM